MLNSLFVSFIFMSSVMSRRFSFDIFETECYKTVFIYRWTPFFVDCLIFCVVLKEINNNTGIACQWLTCQVDVWTIKVFMNDLKVSFMCVCVLCIPFVLKIFIFQGSWTSKAKSRCNYDHHHWVQVLQLAFQLNLGRELINRS